MQVQPVPVMQQHTVMVQQVQQKAFAPTGSEQWNVGLFDCFSSMDVCLITYFCPCVTFGKTMERMGSGPCILVACCSCPSTAHRGMVRAKYGIQGDCLSDCLVMAFCGQCALCQMEAESLEREAMGSIACESMER
eukprot:TRINITY_DN565_c0_g2_i5.p1 TRINITY_DN565_c0_g2~~TRINITY_DN565_c0_g2_i5.p1  ORF type:complete len:135 (+),score=30.36 TRINITY_DN565_c0_g2_i5:92-496(+)